MTSPEELAEARAAANGLRGDWIIAVREGISTPQELIAQAAITGFEALRAITLKRLMTSLPDWGEKRANRLTEQLVTICGGTVPPGRLTVGWLIDKRAAGRRLIAFANLTRPAGLPWPGFPFAPKPSKDGATR